MIYHKKRFISEVMLIADADYTDNCQAFFDAINNTQYDETAEVTADQVKAFNDAIKSKDTLRGAWFMK